MLRTLLVIALLVAVAAASYRGFGYGGYDENRDGLADRLDLNRDGKVDYGYGYGRGYGYAGRGYGAYGSYGRGYRYGGYY